MSTVANFSIECVNSLPMSSSDLIPSLVDKVRYEARRGEVQLQMSHFCIEYLNDVYRDFDGDLAMAIVLGEISHHNTSRFFSPDCVSNPALTRVENKADWSEMTGCNAYSISLSTAIPRETVRRKVAALKKRGWIETVPGQGLRITPACGDHFSPDFSWRILNGLLRASRAIEDILSDADTPGSSASS